MEATPIIILHMIELRRNINGVVIMSTLAMERGLPLRPFLAGTGLRTSDLDQAATTVSFEQEFQLIRNLLAHCGDPAGLGFEVGSRYRFTSLASVGFALVSSPNLRSAYDITLRYADLNASLVRTVLDAEADDLRIGFRDRELPADLRRFAVERTMGVALTFASDLLGRKVSARSVDFSFAKPGDTSVYRTYAGVTPSFSMERNLLVLKQADVEDSLAHGNPLALRLAEEHCRQYLASWKSRSGIAEHVRDHIARHPRRMADMEEVAVLLNMSVRTLRRRLEDEGTTYLALCDEFREALAEQFLTVPRLPIEQIAERLGYSESASFIRAFKRWKGQTPHAYRRSMA
jgi:AraC-like DNA-binding protein